jgi:rubrerythrin
MRNREFVCDECETEFEVLHDKETAPEFCPFCGDKLTYEEEIEEEWEEEEE